jgi:hypothetical protein
MSSLAAELAAQQPEAVKKELLFRKKLDDAGQYLRFPGVTVVSHIPLATIEASLAALPGRLRELPTIGPWLAPLPAASYHVTVLDVCCQYKLGLPDDAFGKLLEAPHWAEAAGHIEEASFVPSLRFKAATVIYEHPKLLLGVQLEPAGPADRDTLNAAVEKIVQPVVGELRPPKCWHMTLGYNLPKFSGEAPLEPSDVDAACAAAQRLVEEAFGGFGNTMPLLPAKLCRFEDMTAFVPWSGETS